MNVGLGSNKDLSTKTGGGPDLSTILDNTVLEGPRRWPGPHHSSNLISCHSPTLASLLFLFLKPAGQPPTLELWPWLFSLPRMLFSQIFTWFNFITSFKSLLRCHLVSETYPDHLFKITTAPHAHSFSIAITTFSHNTWFTYFFQLHLSLSPSLPNIILIMSSIIDYFMDWPIPSTEKRVWLNTFLLSWTELEEQTILIEDNNHKCSQR